MIGARPQRDRRSFTLLEVLIAIGLSLALLGSVFTFYFNVLRIRRDVHVQSDRQRAATTLIDQLERDLLTCIAAYGGQQPGVRGDAVSLTIASRGVATALAERGMNAPDVFSDLQVTTYRFNTQSQQLSLQRGGADAQTRATVVSDRLAKVRFRYYDGSQWREQYNSIAADALPIAVEVAVWFEPFGDEALRRADEADERTQPLERETFDAEGGFDDYEFAMRDDRGFGDDAPLPDRFRVIHVPDAAAAEDEGRP